jgi:hypothetical protein
LKIPSKLLRMATLTVENTKAQVRIRPDLSVVATSKDSKNVIMW